MMGLEKFAEIVDTAAKTAEAIPQFSEQYPDFSVEDAYAVQAMSMNRRYQRGEKRIGVKMGLTSRAKMMQMGVENVIWGRLTDGMILEEGDTLSKSAYVHPRVEPEICFLLKKPLVGRVTMLEAMNAVEAVAPAIEVIDSRYQNFKFALNDVVADNSSSSGLVIGDWRKPDMDLSNLGMVMSIDGKPSQVGSSAAILGHPVRSLIEGARMVAQWGECLNEGDILMAGGATAAVAANVGDTIKLDVQKLGAASISVVE